MMKNFLFFALALFLVGIMCEDANGYGYDSGNCETVYTTTTIYDPAPTVSTFIYTKTEIVAGNSANVVTNYVEKPESIAVVTSIMVGQTKTLSFYTTTKKYIGAKTTKTFTSTTTVFPYATTTVSETEYIIYSVKGTLTVTYPAPIVSVQSVNRYTGAPTSLWLSVI